VNVNCASQSVTSANLFKQAFIMTFSDSKEDLSLLTMYRNPLNKLSSPNLKKKKINQLIF